MQPEQQTYFASPERLPPDEVRGQSEDVAVIPYLRGILDTVPEPMVVLNAQRQIILANAAMLALAGAKEQDLLGRRPGEALGCVQSWVMPAGCGTSEFCEKCGAANAILGAQKGHATTAECRITDANGDAFEFRATATPLPVGGRVYTFLCLADRRGEVRRRILERLFFHDVLNTAGGVYGFADLLTVTLPEEGRASECARTIFRLSEDMIDELEAQRQLAAAEAHELAVEPVQVDVDALLQDLAEAYRRHQVAQGREIRVPRATGTRVFTDRTLLRRVVGNMTKNALEATPEGGVVTLACQETPQEVTIAVNNPTYMPRDVQLQVFRRSFSTKGSGRGLGTHSIKLLGEHYLGGTVSFTTLETEGTTFRISLPQGTAVS